MLGYMPATAVNWTSFTTRQLSLARRHAQGIDSAETTSHLREIDEAGAHDAKLDLAAQHAQALVWEQHCCLPLDPGW